MGLRYRLNFTYSDAELSSPVQENITALQGFFRDSFQCDPDPAHVDPDVHDQSIIPDKWLGNAPFFLYYDKWLRQQEPFYPENYLDIRSVLPIDIIQQYRNQLADMASGKGLLKPAARPIWAFCLDVLAVWDKLQAGHSHFYTGEYPLARIDYQAAYGLAYKAMQDNVLQGLAMAPFYNQRKKLPLNSLKDLPHFMDPAPELSASGVGYGDTPDWARDRFGLRLAYYALFTIPVCLGDAEYAMGDYEQAIFHYGQATRFAVGIARETDSGGYHPSPNDFEMYWVGDKPYTVRLNGDNTPDNSPYPYEEDIKQYDEFYTGIQDNPIYAYAKAWSLRIPTLTEIRYCRLRQANVMLEWADSLYRLNEPTSMARARELYKGVLWLHGKIPPICPTWPASFLGGGHGTVFQPSGIPSTYLHHSENPALVAQTNRAYLGIYQIDHRLNYYGEDDNIVPILRYRPLKETADRMAAMARGAQQDFILYTDRIEVAMTTRMQLSTLYSKLRTSPLDTGLEQGYTCSIQLLDAPGKVSFLHPARPIEKARTSLAPFLSRTDHERVAPRAPQYKGT